jgi:hypothetical protein
MKDYSHLILGYGDVGKGLQHILQNREKNNYVYDPQVSGFDVRPEKHYDILHICYPYSINFIDITNDYIRDFKPSLLINHSSVQVGTTRRLKCLRKVHSPIRGRHPNIVYGIENTAKFIGAETIDEGFTARDILWHDFGLDCRVYPHYETTELAKLLSLVRYGLNIAFTATQKEMCDVLALEYTDVVIDWELTTNAGFDAQGLSDLKRPVLYPLEGPIGGHCIIPVSLLVKELFQHWGIPTDDVDVVLKHG